jgi:uncharacterized membrane protein YfcA
VNVAAGGSAVGLLAGLLSGAFGIGGGIVMVPLLALVLGVGQHEAQGVTLAVMLLPIGLPAVLTYHRLHPVRWRLAALIALGFLPGSWAGAKAASALPGRPLRALFVLFLLHVAWRTWTGPSGSPGRGPPASDANGLWIGALAGGLAGLFGVGGGIVMVAFLVSLLGQSQHEAQGTSLAVMLPPIGLPGVWVYAQSRGGLPWGLMAAVAGGFLAGALAGAQVASRTGSRRLSRAFAVLVVAAAAALALRLGGG